MYLLITTCTIVCERVLGLRQLLERNEFGRSSFPDISRFKVQSSNSFVYLCAPVLNANENGLGRATV